MLANSSNQEQLKLFALEALKAEPELDLGRAALLMAKCQYPKLDIEVYIAQFDEIAEIISSRLSTSSRNPLLIIKNINDYFFQELAFQGNKENYYDPRNSFLNEVLVRRLGIPISLSVIYMEVAKRLGLTIDGVGLPGHFLVKCKIEDQEIILDPFHQGKELSQSDCQTLLTTIYGSGIELKPSFFRAVSKKEILIRMLNNLKNIYISGNDPARALITLETLLILTPQALNEIKERGFVNYRLRKFSQAIKDIEFYLSHSPKTVETDNIRKLLNQIKLEFASLN
ncbi:MAG: transglutaminase family protein [Blastocatellia bacterium]|nr:transglutaminase family protein [Blastocatellia bacterium]MBN8722852.1 transglutaminase family protein [Acidobacteriota bacterium]